MEIKIEPSGRNIRVRVFKNGKPIRQAYFCDDKSARKWANKHYGEVFDHEQRQ